MSELEKGHAGDFDLDGLCSELKAKAKCSGGGTIDPKIVKSMLTPESTPGPNDAFKMFS